MQSSFPQRDITTKLRLWQILSREKGCIRLPGTEGSQGIKDKGDLGQDYTSTR